jgi:hypothetical protein
MESKQCDYSPTSADVERYLKIRVLAKEINSRMVHTVPREAMIEIAKSLGMYHKGTVVFDSEDMSSVLMDCCLYDWIGDGKNLVTKYAENNPALSGTDEKLLQDAFLQAHYTMLLPESGVRGAGIYCTDTFTDSKIFVMDVGFSQTASIMRMAVATRIVPIENYWMTTGTPLPIRDPALVHEIARNAREIITETDSHENLAAEHSFILSTIRMCLKAGAADYIRYGTPDEYPVRQKVESNTPEVATPLPARNEPCPCGSGKKYKKCCGK